MAPDSERASAVPAMIGSVPEAVEARSAWARLRDHETYKTLFVDPWTYTTGAVVLALLNVALILGVGKAWGVTTSFTYWGAWGWSALGGDSHAWLYFSEVKRSFNRPGFGFSSDTSSITNAGIVVGALLATLLANQFRVKRLKAKRQVVSAILGGLLMGFGARLAFGCNIGSMFTAIPSLSAHGWVFMAAVFGGAVVGARLLVKYFV